MWTEAEACHSHRWFSRRESWAEERTGEACWEVDFLGPIVVDRFRGWEGIANYLWNKGTAAEVVNWFMVELQFNLRIVWRRGAARETRKMKICRRKEQVLVRLNSI